MNIKILRKAKAWTQTELATKIGVSQKLIADYETGATRPPLERVCLLAKTFEVTTDELLGLIAVNIKEENQEKTEHGNTRTAKMQRIFKELSESEQKSVLQIVKKMTVSG